MRASGYNRRMLSTGDTRIVRDAHGVGLSWLTDETAAAHLQHAQDGGAGERLYTFYAIGPDEIPAGFMILQTVASDLKAEQVVSWSVEYVFVDPAARGRGLARTLAEAAIAFIQERTAANTAGTRARSTLSFACLPARGAATAMCNRMSADLEAWADKQGIRLNSQQSAGR